MMVPKGTLILHYPLVIEYCFEAPQKCTQGGEESFMPEGAILRDKRDEKLNELLLLLSVFTNYRFFVYQPLDMGWYVPIIHRESTPREAIWGVKAYDPAELRIEMEEFSSPECGLVETVDQMAEYYDRFSLPGSPAVFPPWLDNLFSKYFSLVEKGEQAYLSSCTLFCNGADIWRNMRSLSFAAFISCIETLIAYESKTDPASYPIKDGVTERFRNFLNKHGSPDPNIRIFASMLYEKRSRILHDGQLLLRDLSNPFFSEQHFREDDIQKGLTRITRMCLVNWLIEHGKKS